VEEVLLNEDETPFDVGVEISGVFGLVVPPSG